jgi:hypothetical protein
MHRIPLTAAFVLALVSGAHAQREQPAPPSWADSAAAMVPKTYVAGEAYLSDFASMTGHMAVYPTGSDDPKTPGSVFAPRQVLEVRLGQVDGKLSTMSVGLKPREHATRGNQDTTTVDPDAIEREYVDLHKALAATKDKLPPGTEPCDLRAWSTDIDMAGLNVRAEPSAKARVLGTLPPPFRFKTESETAPDEGYRTEFTIRGYKDGWFLIDGATPPGRRYVNDYPKRFPKPYAGRGWVHASKVGAQYANGDTRMGGLFQAPHADARWTPAGREAGGGSISADGGPKRVLACSGYWALVEAHDGVRGWWRRLCSSQVTTCS